MILSFYNKNFKGLQNNASLVIDNSSYKLVKKPIELNELSCVCEAFTEDIQPTFLIIKDDIGGYVYGSLAGIPELNKENKTEVNGTDLKTMLSSDVIIKPSTYSLVKDYLKYLFNEWNSQVMQGTITCELIIKDNVNSVAIENLVPTTDKRVVNGLEEMQSYLKYYGLYLDTKIDLINKKVQFIVGKTMFRNLNVKLWEYGIRNYGKWVTDVNECQGYYVNESGTWTEGIKWILTSKNEITSTENNRDIFPVKRKVIINEESKAKADIESLTTLLDSLYNENIELEATNLKPDFETNFAIYLKQGQEKYKDLPCGYLQYNASGLVKFQIGYRYTDIKFI